MNQTTKTRDQRTEDLFDALTDLHRMPKFPAEEKDIRFLAKQLAMFVATEPARHEILGTVNPMEWLIGEIFQRCTFFPSGIQIRRIYEESFAPLDGRASDELTEMVEG